jgi:cytochrome c oxidase subunit 3
MDIPYTVKARPDTGLFNAKVGIWLFLASEVMLFGALFSSYILERVGAAPGSWPQGLLNIPIGTFNTVVLITSSITVIMSWASLKMNQFNRFKIFQGLTVCCALAFLGIKSKEYKDKFHHYEIWLTTGEHVTGHIKGGSNGKIPADPYFYDTTKLLASGAEEIEIEADPTQYHDQFPKDKGLVSLESEKEPKPGEIPMTFKVAEIKRLSAFVPAHSTYFACYFTMTALHALHVFGGMIVMAYLWGPGAKMWKTDPDRFINRVEVSGLFWHFVDLVWIFLFPVLYLL